jgi:LysR family transcriptional regulator, glycine cleavage system transcriptional activator
VSAAAEELCVTPSAVSHQITGLERHLGVRLFHRMNRRIALTDAGRGYVQLLASGFDRIARATEHIASGRGSDVLTVHCLPSFAPAWLVPRLASFMAKHPDIDLRIHATPEPAEFFRSDTDVELRYGNGEWPGLEVVPVMSDAVVPVAAVALRDRLPLDLTPADILALPLIHSERALVGWAEWARALGLGAVPSRGGLRFDRGYLAIQAASEGLGVALETRVFVARDISQGRVLPLLQPEQYVPAGRHYLVYPTIYADLPKVAAFRTWMIEAATSHA